MATPPVFWPGKIPWAEEPDRLKSKGSQRARHDLATQLQTTNYLWTVTNFLYFKIVVIMYFKVYP